MDTKIVFLIAGTLCATFVAGFIIGQMRSPDFDNPNACRKFIAENVRCEFLEDEVSLRYVCGTKIYGYDSLTHTKIDTFMSVSEWASVAMPKRGASSEVRDLMLALFGGGEVVSVIGGVKLIKYSSSLTKGSSGRIVAIVALAVLPGFILGYVIGYDDSPECESATFQSTLNDLGLWRALSAHYKSIHQQTTSKFNIGIYTPTPIQIQVGNK